MAAPAYVFFYMRLHGKVNWSKSIIFTAATLAVVIVVYGLIFGTNLACRSGMGSNEQLG